MPVFTSVNFEKSILSPQSAGEVYVTDDRAELPITLALGDIIKVGYLPADCTPVDLTVHVTELDTHATDLLRYSVGLLDEAGTDLIAGTEFLVGGKAEAIKTVRGDGVGFLTTPRDKVNDRAIAVKITAAGATKAAGTMRVIMSYRASEYGI